jgi:hypothetical protein
MATRKRHTEQFKSNAVGLMKARGNRKTRTPRGIRLAAAKRQGRPPAVGELLSNSRAG